ncbi:hypothetical protein EW145_g2205 [Phellinidium pouzarii]|uniref:Uncharacterized protein n=1 Tax=Phellinidium pouzarii TaxID=167371 RepID=A0A4V6S195_9AGAM|nr:hypothetical protein EW145_g2205 [Phellinidium pouzarii]
MPAKYSHAKKRLNSQPARKSSGKGSAQAPLHGHGHAHRNPNPHLDRSITQTLGAVSELERSISAILLIRYEQDIARLYSTRLHSIALIHLPKMMYDCINLTSPGWIAANADCDEIKDFFRGAIAMDMRQVGGAGRDKERVMVVHSLTTFCEHTALSNNVSICQKRGLHSLRLLPHFQSLKSHLSVLQGMPLATFAKPTHLESLEESLEILEDDLSRKHNKSEPAWNDWKQKVRVGYERLVDTLWGVAKEFDVRGYGLVLREKLTTKWCDCGCSTDHLGEVCEPTVREEEEESGIRSGKEREWDGRGSGVFGWQTDEEEDIWEIDLDFGGLEPDESDGLDPEMTIGELMEWRYFKAEKAKELGNKAFRDGDYESAIKHYSSAYDIEPELPHYQLNIAAAHLKLSSWIAAEKACNIALAQHRSGKGYWRRAKARRMQGRTVEAVKDLRAVLKIQPGNAEALAELLSIMPSAAADIATSTAISSNKQQQRSASPGSSSSSTRLYQGGSRNNGFSSSTAPSKENRVMALPFELAQADNRKLRIYTHPLQVEMPVIGKGRGKSKVGVYDIQIETYSYPTWERCKIQRASQ